MTGKLLIYKSPKIKNNLFLTLFTQHSCTHIKCMVKNTLVNGMMVLRCASYARPRFYSGGFTYNWD